MPFVLGALLQQPDDMHYGLTTFHELTPQEQRKIISLNQQIYQLSQHNVLLLHDIAALQNKQFYMIAKTDAPAVPKETPNTVPLRYITQMRGGMFAASEEIAVRQLVMQKYAKRMAVLQAEGLALYMKADADCNMRMGMACYDTDEMHARFRQMCLGVPTSAEMQGRLTLEDVYHNTWDGVPRSALKAL